MQRRRRHLMMRRTTRRGTQRRRGLATFMLITLGVFGLMFAGSVLGTAGGMLAAYNYFATGLPDPRILDNIELPQSTEVYDRTGKVLLARFECQNREAVDFAQIPPVIVSATVASEDRTFWSNSGIDVQGIGRALLANVKAGKIVQGASTITQQVIDYAGALRKIGQSTVVKGSGSPVPSVSINPDQALQEQPPSAKQEAEVCQPPLPSGGTSFEQKIREQILATQVTNAYPGRTGKERIMATYLNLIYYGNGSYGIKAAAANYFGLTDLTKMTPAQAAFLAALPQAPSFLDPYQNPKGAGDAIRERNLVLGRMRDEHYITPAQYRGAVATTWDQMNPSRVTSILREPQFSFRVRGEAERILGSLPGITDPKLAVRTGGYKITTTIDLKLQEVAKEEVKIWVANLADKNVNNGALVAINSKTGEIVAYVGSVDYNNRKDPRVQGQFDVAGLGVRQPGSAFKPITYTSAFKAHKATVSTMLVDTLTEFGQDGTTYRPTNADIKERGPVLATDALRYSMNIPSVQMQFLVGPATTATFAESLGIASKDYIMGQDPGLTLTLGSVPVNLTNMTQAYGVFAAQGELHPATTILEIRDRNNRLVYSRDHNGPEVTKPLTPPEAYLTHWILEGNTDPARNLLWGTRAMLTDPNGFRRHAGFKTGTTDDFRDVSGFGYVPGSLVTGVWMGNNNQEPMSNVLGVGLFSADGPLYMWHDFMQRALNEPWDWNKQTPVAQTDFAQPAGIEMASVCRFSGMAANGNCGRTQVMPFLPGTVPPYDNVHSRGCLDIVQYVRQSDPPRPESWAQAARIWSDRAVNGDYGARGDPKEYLSNPYVRFTITPILGERLPAVCGNKRAVPPKKPKASPAPSGQPTPAPSKKPKPPGPP
jgi:membrane peptidoglycan carboxypeptidase